MKVIIAGGGISGLVAARELLRNNHSVLLLEPRSRLGGRILTVNSKKHHFAVDLGPEFVHGHAPETMSLIADPQRDVKPLVESQKLFWRGQESAALDISKDHDRFLKAVPRSAPDVSAAHVLNQMGLHPLNRAILENYIEGFNAADIHSLSAQAYAAENENLGDEMNASSHFLPGYSTLIEKLRAHLGLADIQLETRAVCVRWKTGEVEVEVESKGARKIHFADAFLSTVPVGFYSLGADDPAHLDFVPEISQKRAAAKKIVLGHVHKQVLIFKRPLWEPSKADIEFVQSPDLTFGARWRWGWQKPFTLTSWCGGRKAFALAALNDEEILEISLRDLSPIARCPVEELKAQLDEVHAHNWLKDPWSRGAYSYVHVGGREARDQLFKPVEKTLFFAGEATMSDGSAATVHGAIRSALRAVREMQK